MIIRNLYPNVQSVEHTETPAISTNRASRKTHATAITIPAHEGNALPAESAAVVAVVVVLAIEGRGQI